MAETTQLPLADRAQAASPDLRLARAEVYQILAIDIAELASDATVGRRVLQRLRADDKIFDRLKDALLGKFPGCEMESDKIQTRMADSLTLKGKAVWTDQFLERFAPIRLATPLTIQSNEVAIGGNSRLSRDPRSPLHYVKFQAAAMKMYRDGTITYVARASLETHQSRSLGDTSTDNGPATIPQAIERLAAFDRLLISNFREALRQFIGLNEVRDAIESAVSLSDGSALTLKHPSELSEDYLKRKVKEHRVVFVEKFLVRRSPADPEGLDNQVDREVPLQSVLNSSSLAGLLNTASWYEHYNSRYVESLRLKEIGYREDEIYLTDRKSTVVSAPGFWTEHAAGSRPADPLSRYKYDVVLAVEYNLACLAYASSILAYFQEHPDVHGVENHNPSEALPHVIDGRSILSRIEESLDLSLLVDHGFTRVFIRRLREELGLDQAIGFIRRRVEDTSTSVNLKSSVLAAEQTSKESLQAAVKNNVIQRSLAKWAIAAVIVAILLSAVDKAFEFWLDRQNQTVVCVSMAAGSDVVCRTVPTNRSPSSKSP